MKFPAVATSALIFAASAASAAVAAAGGFQEKSYNEYSLQKLRAAAATKAGNLRNRVNHQQQQGTRRRTQEIVHKQRLPTYSDFLYIQDHYMYFVLIDTSTCPDAGDPALETHWDYNYQDYISAGMNHTEALMQDCTLFKRERNPRAMGSRLVRHAFHDAAGGFNGFVNVHDLAENGGLFSSQKVLLDDYYSLNLPNADGATLTPVEYVLSLADFSAWAEHAALNNAAAKQVGGINEINDGDVLPPVRVLYGRLSYHNTTVDDTGPVENFPFPGPSGSGQSLTAYFANEFGLSAEETATLMGVHTFGGARREDSGYKGMWTQSKNVFNNEYQQQLRQVLPLTCVTPDLADERCTYFSIAGSDRSAPLEDQATCDTAVADSAGRCEGWEQVEVSEVRGSTVRPKPKFQWRNVCRDDFAPDGDGPTGCEHVMLNVDVGLYRNIDGHICTADDEANGVTATRGRPCIEGMIKSYPTLTDGSKCDETTDRVLATCFEKNAQTSQFIDNDADDMVRWINNFGPLFEKLLAHGQDASSLVELVPPTASPTASPTSAPTPTPCDNDVSWVYTATSGATRDCGWVSRDSLNRCNTIGDSGAWAFEACPKACDCCTNECTRPPSAAPTSAAPTPTPCLNDPGWVYTRPNGGVVGCNFVSSSPADRCNVIGDDGAWAGEACPSSCQHLGCCDPEGCVQPTSAPTATPCFNDPAWQLTKAAGVKTCGWVGKNVAERCGLYNDGETAFAYEMCKCACDGFVP